MGFDGISFGFTAMWLLKNEWAKSIPHPRLIFDPMSREMVSRPGANVWADKDGRLFDAEYLDWLKGETP